MSKLFIGPMHLLGAAVMLAPMAAASAASPAKHAMVSHAVTHAPTTARHAARDDDTQTWMMLPVGLAAIGFAIRRQQRAVDLLQPQIV
jgi:hypothetical protein